MKIKLKKLLRYIGWSLAAVGGCILLSEDLKRAVEPRIGWIIVIAAFLLLVASCESEKVSASENSISEDGDNVSQGREIY